MYTAVSRFHAGHRSAGRLLNVLTRQLRAFERGRTPDWLLLRDIIACLNRYTAVEPGAFEATLIDALACADRGFAPARLVLTTEHSTISDLGGQCLTRVESIIDGAVLPRSALLVPAARYVGMYRRHLDRERRYLRRHCNQAVGALPAPRRSREPEEPLDEYLRSLDHTYPTDELSEAPAEENAPQ